MKYGFEIRRELLENNVIVKLHYRGYKTKSDAILTCKLKCAEIEKDGVYKVVNVELYRYKNEANNGHRDYYNKDFKLSGLTQI